MTFPLDKDTEIPHQPIYTSCISPALMAGSEIKVWMSRQLAKWSYYGETPLEKEYIQKKIKICIATLCSCGEHNVARHRQAVTSRFNFPPLSFWSATQEMQTLSHFFPSCVGDTAADKQQQDSLKDPGTASHKLGNEKQAPSADL